MTELVPTLRLATTQTVSPRGQGTNIRIMRSVNRRTTAAQTGPGGTDADC